MADQENSDRFGGESTSEPQFAPRMEPRTASGGPSGPRDLTGVTLGDFQIMSLLGHGGMGDVYLARQLSLNREVAIKVLRSDLLSNPTYLGRFEKEALAAAKINHPNIVHVYAHCNVNGVRFIAMEYVQGMNLRAFISKKGPPDLPLALSILRQSAMAISAAGEMGLIHRDIKPENLLLNRKGQVKVADFGLCREQDAEMQHLTQPGVTLGTPMYMSPEQVQGRSLDHRSDLYSLGVTAYHMLAGFPPFRAETVIALAYKHVNEEPVDIAVHRPDLPADLTKLVMKLMAKNPRDRFQSAAELLRELNRIKDLVRAGTAVTTTNSPTLVSQPEIEISEERPAEPVSPASTVKAGWRTWPSSFLRPRLTSGYFLLLTTAALFTGAALGWMKRSEDLFQRSQAALPPPALWMVDWRRIPRQIDAATQYRHAQLLATPADTDAAWLAVPGYFPRADDWDYLAYVQLGRSLYRQQNAVRLADLAAELETDVNDRPALERHKTLATVLRGGVAALRGDTGEALQHLMAKKDLILDVSLAQLTLEITRRLERSVSGAENGRLQRLQNELRETLQVDFLDVLDQGLRSGGG